MDLVTADAATSTPSPPPERAGRFRYTLPGAWTAVAFAAIAFTPSLLPRPGVLQGLIAGISAAIGYGLGVVGAWVWRAFADREVRPARPRSWRAFTIAAPIILLIAWAAGWYWQNQLRDLMDADPDPLLSRLLMPILAVLMFVGLVALGRFLRRLYLRLAAWLQRRIGPRAARAIGWVAVVVGTYLVVSGVLLQGAGNLANESFSLANGNTKEGVTQPTVDTRSGGPGSLVAWDSLGREGRSFAAGGPTVEEIEEVSGGTASEPIRAYAGLDSAETAEDRARLAVDDLERAGGFDRAYLLVVTTTGSGWVPPGASDSLEYIAGGDSAIIGMQYSYLPSWISYLVDQAQAREAGRALFDAVYERWSALAADSRPRLLVFGESLGSFGAETAFSGEQDLATRTSGALLVGPPNFNTLFTEFRDHRDDGSLEVEPVYKSGRIVRFESGATPEIEPADQPWPRTRVLYLMHPSDPIVWWSPSLLWDRPDWLTEPPGRDVLDATRWIPFVTFWQVSADLPLAVAVPSGNGHTYVEEYVDAWLQVLQPTGWSEEQVAALKAVIASEE